VSYRTLKRSGVLLWENFQNRALLDENISSVQSQRLRDWRITNTEVISIAQEDTHYVTDSTSRAFRGTRRRADDCFRVRVPEMRGPAEDRWQAG